MINQGLVKEEKTSLSPRLTILIGAVVLLILGVIVFDRARQATLQSEKSLIQIEMQYQDTLQREDLSKRNQVLKQSVNELISQANKSGVVATGWAERQINMRQQNIGRELVNPLLISSAKTRNQLMFLEDFDLGVTQAEEGLFDLTVNSRQPLNLTFKGSLYFRLKEGIQ